MNPQQSYTMPPLTVATLTVLEAQIQLEAELDRIMGGVL